MKCLRCNEEISETAKFCEHCGNMVENIEARLMEEQSVDKIELKTVEDVKRELSNKMRENKVNEEVRYKPERMSGETLNSGRLSRGPGKPGNKPEHVIREYGTGGGRTIGRPIQQYNQVGTNSNALIGFILSLVSVPITLFGIVPIISLIFSIKGVSEIGKTGENGKGLAIAGIVISSLCLIVVSIFLFLAVVGSMMV